ncbi:MAG: hypothetical protein ACJ79H_17665 [Myxococcales bacterium]
MTAARDRQDGVALVAMLLPLVVAAAAAAVPPAAPSMDVAGGAAFAAALGPLRAKVGAWAEYLIRSHGQEDVRVRLSLIPPALEQDRAWVEVTALGEHTLPFAARLLVGREGGLERAVLYALGQAPIEVPVAREQGEGAKSRRHVRAPRATRIGSVTVRAGTFEVEELRVGSGGAATRVWRAPQVPLWGLVRADGPRQTVELTAYGVQGARSVFPDAQGKGSESTK